MRKPVLWLFLSELGREDVAYVIPTVAWMAGDAGALFETYLESPRDGRLFAETGSTVLGGSHHQQFNYLCSAFEVLAIRFGCTNIFDSSLATFGVPVLADAEAPAVLYAGLLRVEGVKPPHAVVLGPPAPVRGMALAPYLFPEVLHRRALGCSLASAKEVFLLGQAQGVNQCYGFFAGDDMELLPDALNLTIVDEVGAQDDWGTITLRIAERWRHASEGVVFADPAAVTSQLATNCRGRRVALYQPLAPTPPAEVSVSHYVEDQSPIADAVGRLAAEIGGRVIFGRQTGDGDIFAWSRQGVSIQIIDPNRPAFPVVDQVAHNWADRSAIAAVETSDAQLETWADENRVLTTLIFHSGEVAHNEAMLAMVEMAGWSGLKMGLGAHAARYESAPQTWELLGIPPERGGALGLVEPLLHSGGLGVMAECNCPPELLAENCRAAMDRIRAIAGEAGTPRGYYAFMDTNLDRLDRVRGDIFSAIADAGLEYIISSALPGRNRVLWRSSTSGSIALNQTPRVVEGSSPFVRATSPHDIENTFGARGPSWIVATFDAPVISFSPYIWREGSRFMAIVDELRRDDRINVTPGVVARYARVLDARGLLPQPLAEGRQDVRTSL